MKQSLRRIKKIILERAKLRESGEYKEADKLRKAIERLGYIVADNKNKTAISKKEKETVKKPKNSFLLLFGSGEISPSGRFAHEFVFKQMEKDSISIAIITTPAGFQPNVKAVYKEIKDFFVGHLSNFHPKVEIIFANNKSLANDPVVVAPIDKADYIFTGPGSPTYAAENLKGTLLLRKILKRVKSGASLSLASAATIAFGKFCLPVYEIYKAGSPLHWGKGLNFYANFNREFTVVPHFNNKEGGRKLDTSRCFMGKDRFEKLLKMLPKNEKVIGIDEHTAAIFNLKEKKFISKGKGKLHYI